MTASLPSNKIAVYGHVRRTQACYFLCSLVEKLNPKKINLTSIILTTKSSEDQTFLGNLFLGEMIQELSNMVCDLSSEL
jgi:hypothetical protein